jgi:sec-independent protein translocase protein TatA
MNLGPVEIGLIVLAVMLLFGYKKLPDASRSLGRSLRIFKSEVDDLRAPAPDGAAPGPSPALTGWTPTSGAASSAGGLIHSATH